MLKTIRDNIALALLPRIVWAYLHITVRTSKVTVHGSSYPDRLKQQGSGFIYAFWHNRQIILPVIRQDEPINCLISSSRDGEYITRIAELFGKTAIRGSTTRGGFEAMKQLMRVLESGGTAAITPDGPLGPVYEVKPGVIQISRALGTPIVPIAFDASKKKVFASWDGFNLPYPFGSIAIVFGKPLIAGKSETTEGACARLKKALDAVTKESAQLIGASSR